METVAVFLKSVLVDDVLEQCHSMTRCGNLVPVNMSELPQHANFIVTRAVSWVDSHTVDETRLVDETDNDYNGRMNTAVGTALAGLQDSNYQAVIMSDELFKNARTG